MKRLIAISVLAGVFGLALLLVARHQSDKARFARYIDRIYRWNLDAKDGRKYPYLLDGGIPVDVYDKVVSSLPYSAITMQRTGCYGTCPAYEVRLERSGYARYQGKMFVTMTGIHTGTVSFFDFAHICNAMEHFNFSGLRDDYSAGWTDDSATTVTLYGKGTNLVKRVHEYGGVGPIELWSIQECIDAVVAGIRWTKTEEASNKAPEATQ